VRLVVLLAPLVLSCGPEGARLYVEELPPDARATGGSGGRGGPTAGTSGDGGGGGVGGYQPAPDARPVDASPDRAPDRQVSPAPMDARPPDLNPDRPPMPDAQPPDTTPQPPEGVNLGQGLVGRWKLDEANGNTAVDSAGGDNNGTLNGPARVQGGYPGAKYPNPGALRFDGDNDFVELGTNNLPRNNARQSVAFWFNFTTMPTDGAVCVSMTDGPENNTRLKIGFNENRVMVWKSSGDNLASAPPVAPGWHHYAYTYDGTTHRLYIDGMLRAMSNAAADNGPAGNARLGAIYNNAENYGGLLDEVRIYNRPLTPTEVTALKDGFE
jgi:hypothetical protein